MKRTIGLTFFCLFINIISGKSQQKNTYNFSFEKTNAAHKPEGWTLSFGSQNAGYTTQLDSSVVNDGKYSLSIFKTNNDTTTYGVAEYTIPAYYKGTKIKLTGFLKTENIAKGDVGFWIRIDGNRKRLQFGDMHLSGIQGTNDWKEYSIELPYDSVNAKQIVFGAVLSGEGKIWVDNIHIYLDNQPIESASLKDLFPAKKDTSFSVISGISSIDLNTDKIKLLTNLGMIWGFLKYYHPAITQGKYNWDAELFRHLPQILKTENNKIAYKTIEQWIDSLGVVPVCNNCAVIPADKIKLKPDYGYLFIPNNLPASLLKKLEFIKNNYTPVTEQYYVGYAQARNPSFTNEIPYSNSYPDAGIRLLALYRYWNIIQYFYPSRYLIGEDWNKVLTKFIPKFINAKNSKEYTAACLEVIANIHDTHAGIWSYPPALDSLKGAYMAPFQAKFIEDKLVVTGYYKYTPELKDSIHIGDIIEKIDGVSVDSLVKKYLPLTPASNYETQLRDLPTVSQGFLLRSNNRKAQLIIKRENQEFLVTVSKIHSNNINPSSGFEELSGYKILAGGIGYIFPGMLKDDDITSIKKAFANTKGLIIDLRSYPSSFMPFTYGAWLKNKPSPFIRFTQVSLDLPGCINYGATLSNGENNANAYKGKVVIIVNASTQSSGEYTAMALSTAPNATVIGSTTAGADGNVSTVILPGGISSWISGLGVYYPDGTETQRKGVKIDILVKPTIKGIRERKDELLDKAMQIIENS
ncbi:hypothetical protein A9P82_04635 [Arachidicoccus ginsenosidimutans]|uniref:S41 family peptidase n=1 Tax=Arachidicoccus sp. BS20 TaxID=1850526 RepID=UPI0007F0A5B2|nr:S41 family peptidase [Arachidicoccus sp. BS20]ANI90620.1 hypothetical protein A9P82_04635 [Arachidicoccus sp. BS20]